MVVQKLPRLLLQIDFSTAVFSIRSNTEMTARIYAGNFS